MDETRPFAGVEVVEFGQFIAVPYCAQVLGEGGARVVKIEALEGDPVRQLAPLGTTGETRHYVSRNRGKHVLPLDLRHPGAGRVVERLLAGADVALTNFRPGLAEELGLDAASLAPRYPRLVVGNVSAFGRRGPDARLAGMDLVVQARTGLMAGLGRLQGDLPVSGDAPVADYMCAMTLAFGVAAALLRRERTGRGGAVDVALMMAALVLQNNAMVRVEGVDGPTHAAALARLAELRAAGRPFPEQVALTPQVRTPGALMIYFRTYATKDGVMGVACVSPSLQRALMKALELSDDHHSTPVGGLEAQQRHYEALRARVEAVMRSRTTAEWKTIFDAHGLPGSAVRLPFELLDDEQALANGWLHDLPHPALGPIRVLAPPLALDGEGFRPAPPTEPLGSETRAILAGLGFTPDETATLITDRVTLATP